MTKKEHPKLKNKGQNLDRHLVLRPHDAAQDSDKKKALKRQSAISRKDLDEPFYFQSLVDRAFLLGRLEEETLHRLQRELALLLAFKADQFTRGESSSVRIEIAEMLMHSNLFTLGHYLKSLDTPDDALECIKTTPLHQIYELGLSRLYTSVNNAKKLYKIILNTPFVTSNETYNETIIGGIKGFFKLYDPCFEAHNIHITADYPTLVPIGKKEGIEFILAYLKAIYHENKFCNLFNPLTVHHYLKGLHLHYELLIFNLLEPLLIGVVACHLLDQEETALSLRPFHLEQLYTTLYGLTPQELSDKVKRVLLSLFETLNFNKTTSKKYILRTLPIIVSRLALSLKSDTLDQVVYIKVLPKNEPSLFYDAAPKMDDTLFRELLTELSQCRYASDRMALLLREVKTIEDFEDTVTEGALTKTEINAFLSKLPLIEIAVLIRRHPLTPAIDIVTRSEQDLLLSQCLEEFKNKLPKDGQETLKKIFRQLS